MKALRTISLVVFSSLLLTSCLKDEGEGGASTIVGRIYAYDYDAEMMNLRAQYYAPDEDVYIIYGQDSIFSDRTRTNHDGYYRFEYLRPGTYKVFAYSKNLQTKLPPEIPIIKTVQIVADGQVVIAEEMEIIK